MKEIRKILPTINNSFCLAFIGTDGNHTKHPKYGSHQLTHHQFKSASVEYKNQLYKNIVECIETEIEMVDEGVYDDAPIVKSPYIQMLFKHEVENAHALNKWVRFPELMQFAEDVTNNLSKILFDQITTASSVGCDKMSYKQGFVLEEVIRMTQERWEKSV